MNNTEHIREHHHVPYNILSELTKINKKYEKIEKKESKLLIIISRLSA